MLGGARFSSVTYRLFKLPGGLLEEGSEDFGQAARYLVGAAWRAHEGAAGCPARAACWGA